MKKISCIGLFLLLLCFSSFLISSNTQAAEETTKIMIHRILFSEEPSSEASLEKDGQAIGNEDLRGGQPLAGATFSVYDVSTRFYDLTKTGIAEQEAQKKISEEADQAVEVAELNQKYTKVAEDQTGKDGIVTFDLATYHSGDQGKVYLFMETKIPAQASHKTSNLVIGLPNNAIGKDNILHLYAKNQPQIRRPFFYKYGRDSSKDDKKLAGAEFCVYKETDGRTYYLHKEKYNNQNAWVEDKNDQGILRITSDTNGLVALGDYILPPGIYFFEETKAPEGYEITSESKKVKIEIPESFTQPIKVTVGDTTSSINDAKVINIKKTEVPPDVPKGKLPTTNEQQSIGWTLLGILILVSATGLLIKRSRTKEEK